MVNGKTTFTSVQISSLRKGLSTRQVRLGKYNGKPYVHEALSIDEFRRLFHDHGMDLLGPPLLAKLGEWKVEEDGRITQIA